MRTNTIMKTADLFAVETVADRAVKCWIAVAGGRARIVPIRPLLGALAFISGDRNWGYKLRFGLFEIGEGDMDLIERAMDDRRQPTAEATMTTAASGTEDGARLRGVGPAFSHPYDRERDDRRRIPRTECNIEGGRTFSSGTWTVGAIMTKRGPEAPEANRSEKGLGERHEAPSDTMPATHPGDVRAAEQGDTANIKQNTTNNSFFCGRLIK